MNYYTILMITYGAAFATWFFLSRTFEEKLYEKTIQKDNAKSWMDLIVLLVAGIATLIFGRLYSSGFRVAPIYWGSLKVSEVLNQLFIYSPFILYAILKPRQIWLPPKWKLRLMMGFALGVFACVLFTLLANKRSVADVVRDTYHIQNFHHGIQVFIEDLLICLLLAAFNKAIGNKYLLITICVVSFLFGFGHVPSRLEAGLSLTLTIFYSTLDSLLGITACYLLIRKQDFAWFFPLHFTLDMMQFYSGLQI